MTDENVIYTKEIFKFIHQKLLSFSKTMQMQDEMINGLNAAVGMLQQVASMHM